MTINIHDEVIQKAQKKGLTMYVSAHLACGSRGKSLPVPSLWALDKEGGSWAWREYDTPSEFGSGSWEFCESKAGRDLIKAQ
jgi:hypothetical protein